MLKLDVLSAELNLWANETEQQYRATKEMQYRRNATHLRYLAATLNQSSILAGVTSFNTRTGDVTLLSADVVSALGYTPVTQARTLTINGVTQDLSANRSWTISTATPNLDQVTTAGNTTTNAITVGNVTINGTTLTLNSTAAHYVTFISSATALDIQSFNNTPIRINNAGGGSVFLGGGSTWINSAILNFGSGTSDGLVIRGGGASNGKTIQSYGGHPLILNSIGNNVLIGTTTDAGYKLDVNGTVRTQGSLTIDTSGSTSSLIFSNASIAGWAINYSSSDLFFRKGASNQFIIYDNQGVRVANKLGVGGVGGFSASPYLQVGGSITAASALAQGVYFNNTLVQAAASDVLTAFQITPTFTVNQTLLHNAYWMRFTGAYSPAAYNNPNNNATTIDLANSFTNTANAIGLRIRHTYSNVQNGYGILLESAGFIGIAQTSTISTNYLAGTTVVGSSIAFLGNTAPLNVINGTNGGIKVGSIANNNQHLIISHSEAGNTFSSIRSTFNSTSAVMLIDVAAQGNLRLFGTGNVTVGSATDAGYKLHVNGTTYSNNYVGNSLQIYGQAQIFSGNALQIFNTANNSKSSIQYINGSGLNIYNNSENLAGVLRVATISGNTVAAANNDSLIGLHVDMAGNANSFTGVIGWSLITGNLSGYNLRFHRTQYGFAERLSLNGYNSGTPNAQIYLQDVSSGGTYIGGGGGEIQLGGGGGKIYTGGGNFLIGTSTDAGYKLDVAGSARIQGVITGSVPAGGSLVLGASGANQRAIYVNGYFVSTGAIVTNNYNSRSYNFTIGGQENGLIVEYTGNTQAVVGSINRYFAIAGNINTTNGTMDLQGYTFIPTIVSETGATIKAFTSTLSAASNRHNLYLSGDAQNYIAGNLGVGTTTPTEKLEVSGNVKISGNLTTSPTYTNCGLLSPIGVAENTTETIGFAAKIDPNGWWNPGTKRWTPTVPGFYFVTLQVRWDIGTLGNQINIQILKNLATVGIAQDLLPTNTGLTHTTSAIIEMNGSTDYITFTGYTSSTTGEFIHGEPQGNWTFFNAFKIN